MSVIMPPAGDNPTRDFVVEEHHTPLGAGATNDDAQYWLISRNEVRYRDGKYQTLHELRLRCRHCDYGFNSMPGYTTVGCLFHISEEAAKHVDKCKRTGRTIDLTSAAIRH